MPKVPGDSVQIAREYMDSLLVESRVVCAPAPSARFSFLGETFETPLMTAALSHIALDAMAAGAKQAGAFVSIGMGGNEEMAAVLATGARVMKIIKPYADRDEIFSRIRFAHSHGAAAVGMDVEHAVNVEDAEESLVAGMRMKMPTQRELREYIEASPLPFFVKGALSVRDALLCRDLGCAGVILSHHNGLMRFAVPPVMALPRIRQAVGKGFWLIADGGIESGFDAYKALALGADAVTVGRKLMDPLSERGPAGVADTLKTMTGELLAMMRRTGTPDLAHMDPATIWHRGGAYSPFGE